MAARSEKPADASGISELLQKSPFGNRIRFTLQEQPAQKSIDDRNHRVVLTQTSTTADQIVGMANRNVHHLWINGHAANVGYLSQLRTLPGTHLTRRHFRECFGLLEKQRQPDEQASDFTSILTENHRARRILERQIPGFPIYQQVADLVTLSFSSNCARSRHTEHVTELDSHDQRPLIDFLNRHLRGRQLAPQVTPEFLNLPGLKWWGVHQDESLIACAALWDQRQFKSITVHDYHPVWLRHLRTPINLLRKIQRSPLLPPTGTTLPLAFVTCMAADDESCLPAILSTMATWAKSQSIDILNLGLPKNHPLLPHLSRWLCPEITHSRIYLVHPKGIPETSLNPELPIHPEISLL
jgi:hypothetical protein